MRRSVVVLVVLAAAVGIFTACGGDSEAPTVTPSAAPSATRGAFDVTIYTGTYSGTWTNQASGDSGPVTIAISADGAKGTASLTLDFGGNYLGLGDPPAATLAGTFDGNGAVVKGQDALFGNYDVTIDPNGAIVGTMTDVGAGMIPSLTYTGTLTEHSLDADYTVKKADGTVIESILRMTK